MEDTPRAAPYRPRCSQAPRTAADQLARPPRVRAGSRQARHRAASAKAAGAGSCLRWITQRAVWQPRQLQPLLFGIGEEQLLAADLVRGDRRLAIRRDQPVDEGLAEILLHRRM